MRGDQERWGRMQSKLGDKVVHLYNQRCDAPPLGPVGKMLIETEVNARMEKGQVTDRVLEAIATKVAMAQQAERLERSSLASSRASARPVSRSQTPFQMKGPPMGADMFEAAPIRPTSTPPSLPSTNRPSSGIPPSSGRRPRELPIPVLAPMLRKRWVAKQADWEWDQRVEEDLKAFEDEQREAREQREKEKMDIREMLDAQVVATNARKKRQRELEEELAGLEETRRMQWDEKQKDQESKRREHRAMERESIKNQIQIREVEKKEEEDQRKVEEEAYAQLIADEYNHRRTEDRAKRAKARREIQDFIEYNQKMSEEKRKQKQEEVERDKKYLEEYGNYLERKEQEYKDNRKRVEQRQVKKSALVAPVNQSLAELEVQDASRAEREWREQQQRMEMDEVNRRRKLLDEGVRMKSELARQLNERERRREREFEEKAQVRRQLEHDIRVEEELVASRKLTAAEERLKRAQDLDQQVSLAEVKRRRPIEIKIGARQ